MVRDFRAVFGPDAIGLLERGLQGWNGDSIVWFSVHDTTNAAELGFMLGETGSIAEKLIDERVVVTSDASIPPGQYRCRW